MKSSPWGFDMVPFHTVEKFKEMSFLSHGFFTRKGGVSEGIYASLNCGPGSGDMPEAVVENRARVCAALGGENLITLYQCHSADVVEVTEQHAASGVKQADAMVTKQAGLVLGILTADCGPVLFADPVAKVIGAAHAGWKGAIGGVLENTVAAMEKLGAARANIHAALGPCIGPESYEVGPEFYERFVQADAPNRRFFAASKDDKHWLFNLPAFIVARLQESGLSHTSTLDMDTFADEALFFSYRRTTKRGEKDYGRQISAIMIR